MASRTARLKGSVTTVLSAAAPMILLPSEGERLGINSSTVTSTPVSTGADRNQPKEAGVVMEGAAPPAGPTVRAPFATQTLPARAR